MSRWSTLKMYYRSSGSPPEGITPDYSAVWSDTSLAQRLGAGFTKTGTGFGLLEYTADDLSVNNGAGGVPFSVDNRKILLAQFISDPVPKDVRLDAPAEFPPYIGSAINFWAYDPYTVVPAPDYRLLCPANIHVGRKAATSLVINTSTASPFARLRAYSTAVVTVIDSAGTVLFTYVPWVADRLLAYGDAAMHNGETTPQLELRFLNGPIYPDVAANICPGQTAGIARSSLTPDAGNRLLVELGVLVVLSCSLNSSHAYTVTGSCACAIEIGDPATTDYPFTPNGERTGVWSTAQYVPWLGLRVPNPAFGDEATPSRYRKAYLPLPSRASFMENPPVELDESPALNAMVNNDEFLNG